MVVFKAVLTTAVVLGIVVRHVSSGHAGLSVLRDRRGAWGANVNEQGRKQNRQPGHPLGRFRGRGILASVVQEQYDSEDMGKKVYESELVDTSGNPLVNGANWLVTNVKDGFGRLKMGTSGLWQSYRTCSAIRARVKQGHTPTYPEVAHLQRGKEDRSKVLTALMVWVILPEVFPLLLTVMPAMVPSTFEVPAEVESKYINFSLARARETLKALQDLEQKVYKGKPKQRKEAEEQRRVVLGLLKANSKREAFKELQHCTFIPAPKNKREERVARTSAAQGFPAPMIKCLGKGMGLGLPIAPAFFLRFKIRQYVQDLGPADEALGRQRDESQLGSLSLDELKEACNLRGIDTGAEPSVLRHSLLEWLDLTERAPAESAALGAVFFPDRARVVALGLNFVSSVRDGGRTELAREAINGAW